FTGKVSAGDGRYATVDTPFGPLRGRNLRGLGVGSTAMLFVRPESLGLMNGRGDADNVIESQVTNSEFEGQFFSVFLRGEGAKDIVISMTNSGNLPDLREGETARVGFQAERALVLPVGEVADE